MKRFLFLSKVLAGCAFFSNYHAQNNSSLLGSTNLIAIKKMVSRKKFPTFNFKFSDGQKKSAQSSEKAIEAVYVKFAPETFWEAYINRLKSVCAWLAIGYFFYAGYAVGGFPKLENVLDNVLDNVLKVIRYA